MDKRFEGMIQPSVMKIINENQARLDSLSLATGSTDKLLKIAKDLDSTKRWAGYTASQNILSQLSKTFPQNNLVIGNKIAEMVKKLTESNTINASLLESLKLNKYFIDTIESAQLGFKPLTQSILVNGIPPTSQVGELGSITSKITEVFKQYDQFRELESFKALSRMKNFPLKDIVLNDFDNLPELEYDFDKNFLEIDSEISDEISLVDDFNDLSEERRTTLLELYQAYYYPIRLNCLVILMWLQFFLDQKLDLTNNTFIFVEKSKERLSYISNTYRPNPSGMIDNFIVGGALMLLARILGW